MDHIRLRELYELEYIKALEGFISIPSVYDETTITTKQPFGKGVNDALEYIINYAKKIGFKTYIDPKGKYGYAEIGKGEKLYGVLGHVDVVPVNPSDWNTDPFKLIIKNDVLYGRGVDDDKGPIIAALLAAKSLHDAKHVFNSRIRFIFGTDEETSWRDLPEYFKQKEEIPTLSFTPDSSFPVIYAEKGLINYKIEGKNNTEFRFKAGNATNIVPDKAQIYLEDISKFEANLINNKFKYWKIDNSTIQVKGKASHAKDPQEGVNAINRLLIIMNQSDINSNLAKFVSEQIEQDPFCKKIFGDIVHDEIGSLTLNVGKLEFNETTESIEVDIRFPGGTKYTLADVDKMIKQAAKKYNLKATRTDLLEPIYFAKDSEIINLLYSTYVEVTGDHDTQPLTSGGTTYAKAIPNCVAFGPKFPWVPNTEHQANEAFPLQEMFMAMSIYRNVFRKLTK